jgi:hypothetical protein
MAHLLAALPGIGRPHRTADQHAADVTFTPAGHRPQGWGKPAFVIDTLGSPHCDGSGPQLLFRLDAR